MQCFKWKWRGVVEQQEKSESLPRDSLDVITVWSGLAWHGMVGKGQRLSKSQINFNFHPSRWFKFQISNENFNENENEKNFTDFDM